MFFTMISSGNNGNPDVIITDPPRAGMHEDVIKIIAKAAPDQNCLYKL